MRRSIAVPTLALLLVTAGHAQSPAPAAFEVASIKANRSGAPFRMGPVMQPGGRVVGINLALRDIIRVAFTVEDNPIAVDPVGTADQRRDRALGPRLKASGPDCAPITPPAGVPLPPPPPGAAGVFLGV